MITEDKVILNNGVEMPLIGLGTWDLRGVECVDTYIESATVMRRQNKPLINH